MIRLSAETLEQLRLYAEMLAKPGFIVHGLECTEGVLILRLTFDSRKGPVPRLLEKKLTDDKLFYLRGLIHDMFECAFKASLLPASR